MTENTVYPDSYNMLEYVFASMVCLCYGIEPELCYEHTDDLIGMADQIVAIKKGWG